MAEHPAHRAALAGKAAVGGKAILLKALPEGHVLQVMGATDAESIGRHLAALGLASSVRKAGFQQWYVAGDAPVASKTVAELAALSRPNIFVSDQSHGRVRIGLSGSGARDLLARGTAVDLDAGAFGQGEAAMTLFGHISVHIARTGTDSFELTVQRGFAESLWDELEHLASAYADGEQI